MAKLESFDVKLAAGPLSIGGKWVPDAAEAEAAWELYVELITRISVVELEPDQGLLSEALSSLYTLFDTTRDILREKGPKVVRPKHGGKYSFGYLAVTILNFAVRPFLAKWHPELQDWESRRAPDKSPRVHEEEWPHRQELREELNQLRNTLRDYAKLLATVASVPDLLDE